MNTRELGTIGNVGLLSIIVAVLFLLLWGGCAHAPPVMLWEICRDACALKGGSAAAVVGSVDPKGKPACMCGADQKPEAT